jgi:phage terminase small subunit
MSKDELTIKQRRLVANKAKGMSGAAAAREAGYSPRSAREIAAETLAKPNVQAALVKAMDDAGITDAKIAEVLKEGMAAQRVVATVMRRGKPELIERPDHATRHRFTETAIDVKGAKAPKAVQVSGLDDLLTALDDQEDDEDEAET